MWDATPRDLGHLDDRSCGVVVARLARSDTGSEKWDRRSRRGSCEERESVELRWKAGTTVGGFPGSSTRRAWTRSCRSSRRLVLRRGLGMMSWQSSISRRRPRPILQWGRLRASPPRPATGHLLQNLSRSTTRFLFGKRNISYAAQCRPTSSMGALQRAACQPGYLVWRANRSRIHPRG